MVKNQAEDIEFEKLKHSNKLELLIIQENAAVKEHERKMERLNKLLEIEKAGGTPETKEED